MLWDLSLLNGSILIVLEQPKTSGALLIALTQLLEMQVACLSRLAMRRVADLHPSQVKTNARVIHIIAETARGITIAELSLLYGFDGDLTAHLPKPAIGCGVTDPASPTLERVLGPTLSRGRLVGRYPSLFTAADPTAD